MVQVDNWQDPQLVEAVLVWTGYGKSPAPRRDRLVIEQRFGSNAAKWIAAIESLVDDFYDSKANLEAADLQEMWTMAISDFKEKHHDVPDTIVKALAWCYTFDNK
jgi:hypothetical protein